MADEKHLSDEQLAEAKADAEAKRRLQQAKRAIEAAEVVIDTRWNEQGYGSNTTARGFLTWTDDVSRAVQPAR
jgi:hypothetical protein